MKLKTIPFLVLIFFGMTLLEVKAQSKYVNRASLNYDSSGRRFVYEYDLIAEKPSTVDVKIIYKDKVIEQPHLRGEFGDCIKKGNGKKIIWYCNKDIPNYAGDQNALRFDVKVKVPRKYNGALFTGLIFLGTGTYSIIDGYEKYNKALNKYSLYKTNTNPEATIWADQSRSDFYLETNAEYKYSQYFLAAGGSLVLTSLIMLSSRAGKLKAVRAKKCGLTVVPNVQLDRQLAGISTAGFCVLF